MTVKLVTGYTGTDHVTSADDGALNMGIFGTSSYVLGTGQKLAATLVNANEVSIGTGDLVLQGRHISITGSNSVTIENGSQAAKRRDLIICRYQKDASTNIETAALMVVKGTAGSSYVTPSVTTGNLYNGDLKADFPLYQVDLDGLTVANPAPLFTVYSPENTMANTVAAVRDAFYPVGSEIVTTSGNSPASRFGGSWSLVATKYVANSGNTDGIAYNTHIQSIGWQGWRNNGEVSGTTGKGLRVEAYQVNLTAAKSYSAIYIWRRTA